MTSATENKTSIELKTSTGGRVVFEQFKTFTFRQGKREGEQSCFYKLRIEQTYVDYDKGAREEREFTQTITATWWDKAAQSMQAKEIKQGDLVQIEGVMGIEKYESNGQERQALIIRDPILVGHMKAAAEDDLDLDLDLGD